MGANNFTIYGNDNIVILNWKVDSFDGDLSEVAWPYAERCRLIFIKLNKFATIGWHTDNALTVNIPRTTRPVFFCSSRSIFPYFAAGFEDNADGAEELQRNELNFEIATWNRIMETLHFCCHILKLCLRHASILFSSTGTYRHQKCFPFGQCTKILVFTVIIIIVQYAALHENAQKKKSKTLGQSRKMLDTSRVTGNFFE